MKNKNYTLNIIYFIQYMALSAWLPFYNLFLKDIGFTGAQIGVLNSVFQATLFLVAPIWGMIADGKGNKKVFLIALLTSSMLLMGMSYIQIFGIMLVYMLILSMSHHSLGTLLDSLAVNHVRINTHSSYGQIRVWGSIGWAVGSVILGYILTKIHTRYIFPTASGLLFLTFLISTTVHTENKTITNTSKFDLIKFKSFFRKPKIYIFYLLLLFFGIGVSPIYLFINLYYKEIGANNQIIGIAFAVQALSEIPFFFFGKYFVRKYGAPKLIIFTMCVAILRMLLYSIIVNPIIAVLVSVVQGVSYSLFWVSIVDYVQEIISSKWSATAQSLIWAFHIGAGVTFGNLCIGILSDFITMRQIMLIAVLVSFIALIWSYLYFKKIGSVAYQT